MFVIPSLFSLQLAQAGNADQQGRVMLGPAGRGMGHLWGRGASGGMSTSITTESSSVGSGGGCSNRYQNTCFH